MKNILLYYIVFTVLFTSIGCQSTTVNSQQQETQLSPTVITAVNTVSVASPTVLAEPEILINKLQGISEDLENLSTQCLTISETQPTSSGVVIARSQSKGNQEAPQIISIDMLSLRPQKIQPNIRFLQNYSLSLDKNLIAYEAKSVREDGTIQLYLVTANADFQIQSIIPWGVDWENILGWTKEQQILISLTPDTTVPPASYISVNPVTGSSELIQITTPEFISKSMSDLPYWEGWRGLIIDPYLELVVYPSVNDSNEEFFSYTLRDISSNRKIISFEKVFSAFSLFNDTYPIPRWSENGSYLSFVGGKEEIVPTEFELFISSREGNIKQITNISRVAYIWQSSYSWSPDNIHIALALGPVYGAATHNVNIGVVDIVDSHMEDLCLSVGFQGSSHGEPLKPIWSPSGKQFLVVDEYSKDSQRVLLVDIEKKIVFPVANDIEPLVWMASED